MTAGVMHRRPRASEIAQRVEGGYIFKDQFYSDRQWERQERRREQWRAYRARVRADPVAYQKHLERVARYNRSDPGRETRLRMERKQQARINEEWQREAQRKYGHMADDKIQLLILRHEMDVRLMRNVLRARALDRRAVA